MFGSDVLEVAIGTIFVILIISLLASSIRELIESVLKSRAVQLEKGLRILLEDPDGNTVLKELFHHPMLSGLFKGHYNPASLWNRFWPNLPSYIPSRNFALALLHSVAGSGSNDSTELNLENVKANAMTLPEGRIRQAVLVALGEAENDLERARASIEAWFDSNMDRVSGWYKRKTQLILLCIGLVLAIALNVDSIHVASELSSNTLTRQRVVAEVNAFTAANQDPAKTDREALKKEIQGLSGVVGWDSTLRAKFRQEADSNPALKDEPSKAKYVQARMPVGPKDYVNACINAVTWSALLGWLLTGIAVSLGAPFWFDLLNKFMVVRATVKPYEKSPAEGSEDRKGPATGAQQLAAQPSLSVVRDKKDGDETGAIPPSVSATVRAAIDMKSIDPATLKVTKDGKEVPVPPDGFMELDVQPDSFNQIDVQAKDKKGKDVSRTINRYFSLEDEGEPIEL